MKRIASIQDISCLGRCSLTVALPVISAMGVECAIVPTAVLSAHTAFPGFVSRDLSDQLPAIADHWRSQQVHFDALYTGYIASAPQVQQVMDFFDAVKSPDTLLIVDPAMADHGKLYSGFDGAFPAAMARLTARADVALPNITEACLLTGLEYRETHDDSYIRTLLERLLALGARTAILTGVRTEPGRVGVACMDAAGAVSQCSAPYVPAVFYGTGDLFASTCAGALTLGWSVHDAMELASAYVADTIAETRREPDARWYGVSFEATIPQLLRRMAQRRPSHAEN